MRMLRMLRKHDRRLMTGRCTITRGVWPDQVPIATDVPCVVRPAQRATTEVEVGGEQVGLHLYDIRMPHDQDVARDDVVTVTASSDEQLDGRWLTVVEVVADEWQTSRRVICQESRSG